jgi:hypothetical protein
MAKKKSDSPVEYSRLPAGRQGRVAGWRIKKVATKKIQKEKLTFWFFKPRDDATKLGHNYHTRAHKQANVLIKYIGNVLFPIIFIHAQTVKHESWEKGGGWLNNEYVN